MHMNYDEADLTAIKVGAAVSGMNMDDGTSIFLARELDHIKAQAYEVEYAGMSATKLFDVTSEVPSYAQTMTVGVFDSVAMAKICADYSDDLPNVGVNYRQESVRIHRLGNHYRYSLDEILASQATGKQLPVRLATAARRGHDVKNNQLVFEGDAAHNIVGIFDHQNITHSMSAGWTKAGIATDEMSKAISSIANITKGLHQANTIALPPSVWAVLTQPLTNTATSTLAYFREQNPNITFLQSVELEDIDGNGTKAALVYEKSPQNMAIEMPEPFNQLPPQAQDLHWKIPCTSKTAGLIVYLPLTIHIITGI